MKWLKWILAIVVPGGAGLGIYWATKKSEEVRAMTEEAIATGGTFDARLTGYWPFVEGLSASERLMEGGPMEAAGYARRAGKHAGPLHTLEDVQAGKAPYVSVSCDWQIFPFGQRLQIDAWPGVVFRTVDTGGHFTGIHKMYRVAGHEPLDICVASRDTVVPKLASVTIVKGDHFDKPGAEVATAKMKGQTVTVG